MSVPLYTDAQKAEMYVHLNARAQKMGYADALSALSSLEMRELEQKASSSRVIQNGAPGAAQVAMPVHQAMELVLDMARSHVEDIESGLDDGTYERAENMDLDEKNRAIRALDKFTAVLDGKGEDVVLPKDFTDHMSAVLSPNRPRGG